MGDRVKLPSSYKTSAVTHRSFLLLQDEVRSILTEWVRDQMDGDETAVITVEFSHLFDGSDCRATIHTESRD